MNHARLRAVLIAIWLLVTAGGLYLFLFHREWLLGELQSARSTSFLAGAALYILFGSLRGFTLIPSTTLVVAALPFFAPGPLFALTLLGILISSASIYFFSEALHVEELVARKHQGAFERLKAALQAYQMPIIIGWSFFPLAPTDVVCYACGVLRVDVRKCLLGVAIGEGAICGIYIFLGDYALRRFHLR